MKGQGLLFFFLFFFLSAVVFANVCEFTWDNGKHDFAGCDVLLIKDVGNGSIVFLNNSVFVVKYEVHYVPEVISVNNYTVQVIQKNLSVENWSVQVFQKNLSVENWSVVFRNKTVESVKIQEKAKVVKAEDLQVLTWGMVGLGVLVLFGDRIRRRLGGGGVLG